MQRKSRILPIALFKAEYLVTEGSLRALVSEIWLAALTFSPHISVKGVGVTRRFLGYGHIDEMHNQRQ